MRAQFCAPMATRSRGGRPRRETAPCRARNRRFQPSFSGHARSSSPALVSLGLSRAHPPAIIYAPNFPHCHLVAPRHRGHGFTRLRRTDLQAHSFSPKQQRLEMEFLNDFERLARMAEKDPRKRRVGQLDAGFALASRSSTVPCRSHSTMRSTISALGGVTVNS